MSEYVTVQIKRNHLGQIHDGLLVLQEQWEATREYMESGYCPDGMIIRECSDSDEAEQICEMYAEIIAVVQRALESSRR